MTLNVQLDNPRKLAVQALEQSVAPEVWKSNLEFIKELRTAITSHPLATNPMLALLNGGTLPLDSVQTIHMEYRHAIVQIFTDALLIAQFNSRELENRLAPSSKLAARFLLTLNVLDEFGFTPGADPSGYYRGNPAFAHYPMYEQVLVDLGIGKSQRDDFVPSDLAESLRMFLESSYDSYISVAALLAVAEEQVILYSPPLRHSVRALGCNVDKGYYFAHGTSSDEEAMAADDDHQDDLWYVLAQACSQGDHEAIKKSCLNYCDLWNKFWLFQYEKATQKSEQVSLA